jgi:hypothetical protein
MSIKIEGLSPIQCELADQIWSLDSSEQLATFFKILPSSLLHDAYVVYHMIMQAVWDDADLGKCVEAQEVIDYIRNLPC